MNIRKSIALKTASILTFVLLIAAIGYGIFDYKQQISTIDNIIKSEKEYIIEQLNYRQQKDIKKAKTNLLNSINSISGALDETLFNLDVETTKATLIKFMQIQPLVKAVYILDSTENKPFIIAYKNKKNNIHFVKKLPSFTKNLNFIKFDLIYDKEKIGEMRVYYDLSPIREEIALRKKEEVQKLTLIQKQVLQTAKNNLLFMIFIFLSIIIIINIVIFILMIKFVSTPIKKLKSGLNSFFKFLNNPKEKIEKIVYKSDDEIGEMIQEVNKNMEVSARLHTDIATLMNTIDKNILIITFNENGSIKKVSKALIELTNYKEEELINQKLDLLIADDYKDILKDMWKTLKSNNTFRGKLKLITKDNKNLYLEAIISPKCTSEKICEYDGLFFNITDKQRVEELLDTLEDKVEERTKDLAEAKQEIEELLLHVKDSINYASFIQQAILPKEELFKEAFKDYFVIWQPKDIVGGDIYQFFKISEKDYILLLIDCTGHGVPGAFVTMLVKAVTDQVIFNLEEEKLPLSPAAILNYYNSTIKQILNQYEHTISKSNVGFDGGIVYYNKEENTITFAGAETPLFYVEEGEIKMIKGNRFSIGYKKSKENYPFKETTIKINKDMKFYITSDGFIDQNGGEKDMPLGKKRFKKIIEKYYSLPMEDQKEKFLEELQNWQRGERNDDVTVIGFEIDENSKITINKTKEIFKYEGIITQNVISTALDNIESKVTKISLVGVLSTITIECLQNMMHYSKSIDPDSTEIVPEGKIEILYNDEYYIIITTNIVSKEDKERIEPRIKEILSLDKAGIKKRYRELRKSGKNTHDKGGGIGFYEIAKISEKLEYEFNPINENKYYFTLKIYVKTKRKEKDEK